MHAYSDPDSSEPHSPFNDRPSSPPADPPASELSVMPAAETPTRVAASSLADSYSPRLGGLDMAHIAVLAEVAELPPLLVQRSTLRVIDGAHRLKAIRSRGQDEVYVHFVDCREDEAYLLAVAANVRHGLPLTLADRRAAADRIIQLRPDASDRWVAEIAGLANKTVAVIRRAAVGSTPTPLYRVGRDGRARPVDPSAGRQAATEILTATPDAPLHEVARDAGISIGTVRDVKKKLSKGLDPVTPRRRTSAEHAFVAVQATACEVDFRLILQRLGQDPSLRYTESGRTLLRWLRPPRLTASSDWECIVDHIPSRYTSDVIQAARSCALAWSALAETLDQREQGTASHSA